jgi:hypothetical protein
MSRRKLTRSRQRGQAAIILILLLIFGVSALIYTSINSSRIAIDNDKVTADALALAKEALIGYATAQKSSGSFRPGELPCPDTTGSGTEDSNCAGSGPTDYSARIGLLPWKTLGLPDPRDGAGERLWYAVSYTFKNNSQDGILNSDTAGDYTVTGVTPAANIIAVIFAPGPALEGQDRNSTASAACSTTGGTSKLKSLCAANFLEGGNQSGTATFVMGLPTTTPTPFNDKLLLLTKDNFFPAVEKRVMQELATTMRSYYTTYGYFPNPAAFPGSISTVNTYRGYLPATTCGPVAAVTYPNWFATNNWQQYLVYAVAPRCTPSVSIGIVSLPSQSICSIIPCIGPTFGIYVCVLPDTMDMAASQNCNNTSAGPYLTVDGTGSVEAILISASYKLGTQQRPCNSAADCLEDAENSDATDNYTYVKPNRSLNTNNDSFVQIRP